MKAHSLGFCFFFLLDSPTKQGPDSDKRLRRLIQPAPNPNAAFFPSLILSLSFQTHTHTHPSFTHFSTSAVTVAFPLLPLPALFFAVETFAIYSTASPIHLPWFSSLLLTQPAPPPSYTDRQTYRGSPKQTQTYTLSSGMLSACLPLFVRGPTPSHMCSTEKRQVFPR